MKVGDTAYIVESNRYVREVEIRRCSGGMFLVRFTDTGGGIQVKAHRLFATTREEAEKSIEKAPEQEAPARQQISVQKNHWNEVSTQYKENYFEGCGKSLACHNICPIGLPVEELIVRSNSVAIWGRQ